MSPAEASDRRMELTTVLAAPRAAVYRAFTDATLVAAWMAPGTMTAEVHEMEAREGGRLRVSLTYTAPDEAGAGKTSSSTDTYSGRFVKLVPDELIVEALEFETDNPAMQGELTMAVRLADAAGGTQLTLRYDNLPAGVRVEDNELGTRLSLEKLAALLGAREWHTYSSPGFPVGFRYPNPSPLGYSVTLAEDKRTDVRQVHCRTEASDEVYFEATWYATLTAQAEHMRHTEQLADRFAGQGYRATPLTATTLAGRPAFAYGFDWKGGARAVVLVPLGTALARLLYNPRSPLNRAILATVTFTGDAGAS